MKTNVYEIIFRASDVWQFVKITDDRNPIYESIDKAQEYGFNTIPLPPTMPMIAYKYIEIPWTLKEPLIHRSQECICNRRMYINQPYFAQVSLEEQAFRKKQGIVKQILQINDCDENLCFKATSTLLIGNTL